MKHDIHAPMNRARELYVEAATQTFAARLRAAEQRLRDSTPKAFRLNQDNYDIAAAALGRAQSDAADYFDREVCLALSDAAEDSLQESFSRARRNNSGFTPENG